MRATPLTHPTHLTGTTHLTYIPHQYVPLITLCALFSSLIAAER
jgi:hypothetical protein